MRRGFAPIIIIVLIVVVLFIGITWYLTKNNLNTHIPSVTNTPVSSQDSESFDPISKWKTYTLNFDKSSVEIKLPTQMKIINSLQSYHQYKENAISITNKHIFDIDKIPTCPTPLTYSKGTCKIYTDHIYIYESQSNSIIEVVYKPGLKTNIEIAMATDGFGLQSLFDQILSTFKFTN